jgi:NTE family protein
MSAKIGLALSGGGARGIAHIGVLKVLEEARIPVHMVAGTSMGGVVGAVYAAGRSATEIEQLARSLRVLDILQRNRSGLGLLGQGKIADRVREALGGDLTFDQLKLPLALTAVDLETGEEVVINEGSVVEGILATTAVPIVFPPVQRQGRVLADGGVLNPVPFDVVREMGAERVIAVHTFHDLTGKLGASTLPEGHRAEAVIRLLLRRTPWAPMMDVAERTSSIVSGKLVEQRMQRDTPPDLMIKIPLKGVGLFDVDQANKCVAAGEEAARQHLEALIELRDRPLPLPSRWRHWWQSATGKLRSAVGS